MKTWFVAAVNNSRCLVIHVSESQGLPAACVAAADFAQAAGVAALFTIGEASRPVLFYEESAV